MREHDKKPSRRLLGATLAEFIIVLPVFLILGLGIVQWALVFEAKATLNHATLKAARAGAMHNLNQSAMRSALAEGLAPLYSPPKTVQGLLTAKAKAHAESLLFARFRILNPTVEAFADFGVDVDGKRELPFENLHVRSTALGPTSGVNIQDANLLKLEVTWGHPLKVPLVGPVVARVARWFNPDPLAQAMLAAGRLPILSTSIVRMQSAATQNSWVQTRGQIAAALNSALNPPPSPGSMPGNRAWQSGPSGSWAEENDPPPLTPPPDDDPLPCEATNSCAGDDPIDDFPPIDDGGSGNPEVCPVPGSPSDPDGGFPGFGNLPSIQGAGFSGTSGDSTSQSTGLPSQSVGNPINVVTGNKYQHEQDIGPLPGELAVDFSRHYNSRLITSGVLGHGWRHDYEARLYVDGRGISLYQGDGRRVRFDSEGPHYRGRLAADGELIAVEAGHDWRLPDGRTLHFGQEGRLYSVSRPGGARLRLTYGPNDRLAAVSDTQGRRLDFTYYDNGRLRSVNGPAGLQIRYAYDARGNLDYVRAAGGTTKRYHYDDPRHPHHLTGITDGRGVRYATYAYDEQGRAILSTHAGNVGKVSLEFQKGRTRVTDSQGRVSTYETELRRGIPLVTAVHGPGCAACGQGDVRYVYNRRFQLESQIHADGTATRYERDSHGRITAIAQLADSQPLHVTRYQYRGDDTWPTVIAMPSVKAGADYVAEISYDPAGYPQKLVERGFAPQPEGGFQAITRTREFNRDGNGRLKETGGGAFGAAGTSQLIRDSYGRVEQIRTPAGAAQTVTYNALGRIASVSREGGAALEVKYDAGSRITAIGTADARVEYEYDPAGNRIGIIAPNGYGVSMEYDAAGRLTARSAQTQETRYRWSTDGLIEKKQWSSEGKPISALSYIYDENRRLVALENLAGTRVRQFAYQGTSRQPVRIHRGGEIIDYRYDNFGRLLAAQNSNGTHVEYSTRFPGKAIAVTDARGNTTRYGLDDFGRAVFVKSPDKGVTYYDYDTAGRMLAKRDANGQSVQFTYDPAGRLVAADYPDGTVRLEYAGRQVAALIQTKGNEQWRYDAQGRMRAYTRTYGEQAYTTEYRYDKQGRLAQVTLPGGQKLNYRRDDAGRLVAIARNDFIGETPIITLEMEQPEQRRLRHGNDIATTYRYNGRRLSGVAVEGLLDYSYRYDAQGRIAGIDETGRPLERYRYDGTGRLDFALTPRALYGYRYDANGNRTGKTINGIHLAYGYAADSNRQQHARVYGYALPVIHDAAGNLTQLGGIEVEYTPNGQPARITRGGKLLASYEYNPRAERIAKTVYGENGPVTTRFLYENKRLIAEMDAEGRILRQYLYAGDRPIALLEDRHIHAIHTDHRGAPLAVTDPKGKVIWRADYAPFGRAAVDADPDGDGRLFVLNLRLPGQYEDSETGLHYNYYRYYDPETGRYLSSDPLDLNAGMNTYTYVGNNPIHYVDPLGLLLFAFDGTNNTNNLNTLRDPNNPGDITNVVRFAESYQRAQGELPATPYLNWDGSTVNDRDYYYITGAGMDDPNFGSAPLLDAGTGSSMPARVAHMADYLVTYIEAMERGGVATPVDIDIVGFSRGAASARMFANVVADMLRVASSGANFSDPNSADELRYIYENKRYDLGFDPTATHNDAINADMARLRSALAYLSQGCTMKLNLNFIGLFDTVPHYYAQDNDVRELPLGIPASAAYAAHAVAVNEHRTDFDGVSIHQNPATGNSSTRVEQGFLGAHSDIGGGYAEGDLSDVAFMWMVQQARGAGVNMDLDYINTRKWNIVTNPIVHDSVDVCPAIIYCFSGPDRKFKYMDGYSYRMQQDVQGPPGSGSLTHAESLAFFDGQFMELVPCDFDEFGMPQAECLVKGTDRQGNRTKVGAIQLEDPSNPTAAIDTYAEWLKVHYGLDIQFSHAKLNDPNMP